MRFWVGGWGAQLEGEAAGIVAMTAGDADAATAGGSLAIVGDAASAPSPSWLAAHPSLGVVYAALEGDGRVATYRRTGDTTLVPLGEPIDVGDAVCHVAVAPGGGFLVASCWGDGRVVRIELDAGGRLGGVPAIAPAAEDPYGAQAARDPVGDLGDQERADLRALVERGVDPVEIAGLLAGSEAGSGSASGEDADDVAKGRRADVPEDWSGALDLRALAEGGADPAQLAALMSGRVPEGGFDLAALLRGDGDPFDDPAVRGILAAADERRRASGDSSSDAAERAGSGPDAAADLASVLRPVRAPAEPRSSRAHGAAFLPDGRVATTDLGYDLVRIWRPSRGTLVPDHDIALPHGVGPRHLLVHSSGHLHVVTEFSGEVFTLGADRAGRWRLLGGVPAATVPGDSGAGLARSRDGSFLYAGMRGSDTIAVLRVRGDGDRVEPAALVEAGVAWPRHHVVVRDTLLVTGQRSHEIASLPLDERTGVPGRVRHRAATPSPTVILPTR